MAESGRTSFGCSGKGSRQMKQDTPFDSIESSHEYVSLLSQAIDEAMQSIEAEIALAASESASRRGEALKIVAFKLAKLKEHITSSRRILNDLRTLRRLLLAERQAQAESAAADREA
jgi:hypothetical protein